MRGRIVVGFAIVLLALCSKAGAQAAPPTCGGHGTRETMVVSTGWLADHLNDPNLVIFSIGDESDYDQGHIPGAQYLDYMSTHDMTSAAGLSVELLPMPTNAKLFGNKGVSNDSTIVLYMSKDWFSQTTRVWWTLDAMGLGSRTAILDGGFPAWKAEGRAVTADRPNVTPATLTLCPANDVLAALDDVKASVRKPDVDIVDARAKDVYTGKDHTRDMRAGHIPGALNIPYKTLFDEQGKLKSPDALAEMFQQAGVKSGDQLITYCFIGQQATAAYFAARTLGYQVRLFDGSMEEWSKHTELPVETGDDHK
jgi:thiosulfate/3-mercaptopyruvate sulfurtransferase